MVQMFTSSTNLKCKFHSLFNAFELRKHDNLCYKSESACISLCPKNSSQTVATWNLHKSFSMIFLGQLWYFQVFNFSSFPTFTFS